MNSLDDNDNTILKLSDFGSCLSTKKESRFWYIQSRYYRAPEIVLELCYDTTIDTWSCGCIMAELITGVPLQSSSSLNHLARISDFFTIPHGLIATSPARSKYFYDDCGVRFRLKKTSDKLGPGEVESSTIRVLMARFG